jgi:hypothetical protein
MAFCRGGSASCIDLLCDLGAHFKLCIFVAYIIDWQKFLCHRFMVSDQQKGAIMSKQTHIEALQERHQSLEAAVKEARNAASTDALMLSDLKRRKLALKDEIERLQKVH